MNKKVKIGSGGTFTITDRMYIAAGGEGTIYVNGGKAFKIYHDKNNVISLQKLKELSVINNPNVITPQDIIYDASTGEAIGYVTDFITDTEPLLKYFTKTYKQDNSISMAMILDLIKKMHLITSSIHSSNVLVVDYNELNVLIKNSEGFSGRFREIIQKLKNDFGYIPQQHTVIDNVRGLEEDEPIDTVNEIEKNRRHEESGLEEFEHQYENMGILEKIIFDEEYETECKKVEDELESLISGI